MSTESKSTLRILIDDELKEIAAGTVIFADNAGKVYSFSDSDLHKLLVNMNTPRPGGYCGGNAPGFSC